MPISGTGIAGDSVTVVEGSSTICTATVATNGTWTCVPTAGLTLGAHTVTATQTDGTVGLVPFATVDQGANAIRDAMTQLKERGRRYAIVDAITDAHLVAIGEAAAINVSNAKNS